MLYLWYLLKSGGDAIEYFRNAQLWTGEVGIGTSSIIALSGLLASGLGLSILGVFLTFNIFGQVGLLGFAASLREATAGATWRIRALATVIVFLPSVSFWSSALGKDAISFMATGLALWSSLKLSRRGALMTFSICAMFLVRPHMAGIMTMAITIAFLIDSHAPAFKKLLLAVGAGGAAAVLIPFALHYAGVGEVVSAESITEYIDKRQSYNTEGEASVNIASMSLPMQLFTYLFRPMLFEVRGVFSFAASIDNVILLGLFVFGGLALLRGRRTGLGENRIFMWTYALGSWLVLAMMTANLGIALRQKWMFAPMLIFLLISVIGRRRRVTAE